MYRKYSAKAFLPAKKVIQNNTSWLNSQSVNVGNTDKTWEKILLLTSYQPVCKTLHLIQGMYVVW